MQKNNQLILFPIYIVSSLFPLYGTIKENWSAFYLVYIFWIELLIITFFEVAKIIMAEGDPEKTLSDRLNIGAKFLMIRGVMFVIYLGTLLFILGAAIAGLFDSHQAIFPQIRNILVPPTTFYVFTILNFVAYNFIDFLVKFINNDAYKTAKPNDFTNIFDSHILVVHLFLIFGTMIYLYITQKLGYSQHEGLIACMTFFTLTKVLANSSSGNKPILKSKKR